MLGMKHCRLTIRLDESLAERLAAAAKRRRTSRSQVVREALRRHLVSAKIDSLRERLIPVAQSCGFRTDEDVCREVS